MLQPERQARLRLAQPDQRPGFRPAKRPQGRHVAERLEEIRLTLRVGPAEKRPSASEFNLDQGQIAEALQGDLGETHRASEPGAAHRVHLVLRDR